MPKIRTFGEFLALVCGITCCGGVLFVFWTHLSEVIAADKEYEVVQEVRWRESQLLRHFSYAADAFYAKYGCAPSTPKDFMVDAYPSRLKELGCDFSKEAAANEDLTFRRGQISSMNPELVNRMLEDTRFIKRWDGTFVIQWKSKVLFSERECTFTDAKQFRCI